MKKSIWAALLFLGVSFFLSGLQAALYFFPLPLPAFWFVVLTFYSFKKDLPFSLATNTIHLFVIISYAVVGWGPLLILMNLTTIAFKFFSGRFHTSTTHIVLGAGGGYFVFQFAYWVISSQWATLHWPPMLSWLGTSISTLIVAPFMIFGLERLNQKIEYERVDTLANLRI